jgi:dethiobiotin synthetase
MWGNPASSQSGQLGWGMSTHRADSAAKMGRMKPKNANAHFITGTGTDIGKTWLVCALLRYWREQGGVPCAYKPVLSGFVAENPAASDAGQLLTTLGRGLTMPDVNAIAPWRFTAPLSPDMAAAAEGRSIDFAALVAFTRQVAGDCPSSVLIEGVGGVMAPLDHRHTVRDWIAAAKLPCVLVAGSYLGSLSHTLSALEALRKVDAGVTAIVVNETPESTVPLAATAESLRHHVGKVPVIVLARANVAAGIAELAGLLSSR